MAKLHYNILKWFFISVGILIIIAFIAMVIFIERTNKLNTYWNAVNSSDYVTLQKFIDRGFNIDSRHPKTGSTAIEIAISNNNLELTEFLLKNNATPIYRITGKPFIDDVTRHSPMYNLLKKYEQKQE